MDDVRISSHNKHQQNENKQLKTKATKTNKNKTEIWHTTITNSDITAQHGINNTTTTFYEGQDGNQQLVKKTNENTNNHNKWKTHTRKTIQKLQIQIYTPKQKT